jgi:pimeloyl-ACP methyl ester carboxylesterase
LNHLPNPKFTLVNGVRTRYFEAGTGVPMMLVHGGGITSSAEDWEENFEHFANYFHVYAFDQIGFGYTDKPESDFGLLNRVNHSVSFMKLCGISKAHLVGYSQGGYVAARIALDYPSLARTLVVGDSGTLAPMGNFTSDGKLTPTIALSHNPSLTKEYVEELYQNILYSKQNITTSFIEKKLAIASLPGNLEAARARAKLSENLEERRKLDVSDRLADFQIPTLIIWGRHDTAAPLSRGLKLFESLASADLHIFNECGHNAMLDRREEYNSIVTMFCQRH